MRILSFDTQIVSGTGDTRPSKELFGLPIIRRFLAIYAHLCPIDQTGERFVADAEFSLHL